MAEPNALKRSRSVVCQFVAEREKEAVEEDDGDDDSREVGDGNGTCRHGEVTTEGAVHREGLEDCHADLDADRDADEDGGGPEWQYSDEGLEVFYLLVSTGVPWLSDGAVTVNVAVCDHCSTVQKVTVGEESIRTVSNPRRQCFSIVVLLMQSLLFYINQIYRVRSDILTKANFIA